MTISAQDKAIDFGLPLTIPVQDIGSITIDADQSTGLIAITIATGDWAPVALAVDGIQARQIASAIHAGVRLLAGTNFDMHRRESDRGSGAD